MILIVWIRFSNGWAISCREKARRQREREREEEKRLLEEDQKAIEEERELEMKEKEEKKRQIQQQMKDNEKHIQAKKKQMEKERERDKKLMEDYDAMQEAQVSIRLCVLRKDRIHSHILIGLPKRRKRLNERPWTACLRDRTNLRKCRRKNVNLRNSVKRKRKNGSRSEEMIYKSRLSD